MMKNFTQNTTGQASNSWHTTIFITNTKEEKISKRRNVESREWQGKLQSEGVSLYNSESQLLYFSWKRRSRVRLFILWTVHPQTRIATIGAEPSRIQILSKSSIVSGVKCIPTKRRTVGKWAERKRKMEVAMTKTMHFRHLPVTRLEVLSTGLPIRENHNICNKILLRN